MATVRTSTRHKVHVSVSAFEDNSSGATSNASLSITLSTGKPFGGNGESHTWTFSVKRSSLTYAKPKGKLSVGKQIRPFGSVNLAFHASKSHKTNCSQSGSDITATGTLHGVFSFTSKTHWGHVGGSKFTFRAPNTITINNACTSKPVKVPPCFRVMSWSGPGHSTSTVGQSEFGQVFPSGNKKISQITANISNHLAKPANAFREDSLTSLEPLPKIKGSTVTVHTRSGGTVHGTATISGGTKSSSSAACRENGHKKTQHSTFYFGGTAKSPSRHRLHFNFSATPDYTAPAKGTGSWSKQTVS